TLVRQQHNIFDERTISTNHTAFLFSNDQGFNFISTYGAGLDFFKPELPRINVQTIFQDASHNVEAYDGYINSIAQDTEGNIWMSGSSVFIRTDAKSGDITLC